MSTSNLPTPHPHHPPRVRDQSNDFFLAAATTPRREEEDQGHGRSLAADVAKDHAASAPLTRLRTTAVASSPPVEHLPAAASSDHDNGNDNDNGNDIFLVTSGIAGPDVEIDAGLLYGPSNAALRIQTDLHPSPRPSSIMTTMTTTATQPVHIAHKPTHLPLSRTPSIKNVLATSIGSSSNLGSAPPSAFSSPMLNAMPDVTPLPSPLQSGDSPGPWRRLLPRLSSFDLTPPIMANSALVTVNGESIASAMAHQSKRRAYHGLSIPLPEFGLRGAQATKDKDKEGHDKNRSVSEYVPDLLQGPKIRHIAVSGSHAQGMDVIEPTSESYMRREPHLAKERGLEPVPQPPTPPSSRKGGESSDSDSSISVTYTPRPPKKAHHEYFHAQSRRNSKLKTWRGVKKLGDGTFSNVVLAMQVPEEAEAMEENDSTSEDESHDTGLLTPTSSEKSPGCSNLVAIKICPHGPKGGASEDRIEMSLKRELELLKSIQHPSLVQLKAWSIEETRALLVLNYSPGGDLFELASGRRDLLVPTLIQRIFSELVGAVGYLHERRIVHRDIKLENILVNIPRDQLPLITDWATYPYSIITLTDLGLSRRVADDERLTTRCGSDDYVAPEVILGQPYDGRAIDAWSLGVVLYALLESRLPFDPPPGMPEWKRLQSRTSHRIARVEWIWIEYAGDEGNHEAAPHKFEAKGILGAMRATEGLLKRVRTRWTMAQLAAEEWVATAIQVDGGVRFRDEDRAIGEGDIDQIHM